MDVQSGVAAMTGPSRDMILYQRGTAALSIAENKPVRSPPQDLIAIEAGRLLEDVRMALDYDLAGASNAACRLASLLASNLPRASCSAPARGGLAPWQKRDVRNYIEDQLPGSVRVKDLAKLVSLSVSYFSRAFKESFGELPHAYITKMRIERAKTLMLTTSSSLSQIAFACGLVDQAHLCRCFRQVTGTTPAVWRHSHATGPRSATIVDRTHPSSWNAGGSLGY